MTVSIDVSVLDEGQWRARIDAHQTRLGTWVQRHLDRRRAGIREPVEDFLFDYYRLRPAQVLRWHPGYGVHLRGNVEYWRDVRGYRVEDDAAVADLARVDVDLLDSVITLIRRTAGRPAALGCFGRHEWAMLYRTAEVRHADWPLRVDADVIADVVEATALRCTHVDAFRFFTPAARPLNVVQPTRATQADLEQPGCLHATMDLYKWAYRTYPIVGADLMADCLDIARAARVVDMRASPYDLRALGLTPIRIETAAGRSEYIGHQQEIAERGQDVRRRLLDVLTAARADLPSDTDGR